VLQLFHLTQNICIFVTSKQPLIMKKILSLTLIIVLGVNAIFAQETEASTNSEFVKWQQAKLNGEDVCGEIPPPVLPYYNNTVDYGKDVQFDAVYDLRTQGWLTIPKDQANCGVCWTFTSLGSIESFLLK
jgi:C1A family cysteine protease